MPLRPALPRLSLGPPPVWPASPAGALASAPVSAAASPAPSTATMPASPSTRSELAPGPPESRTARYHRSRVFGQTHRRNERAAQDARQAGVLALREERTLLQSLVDAGADWRERPDVAPAPLRALARPTHALSAATATALGTDAVSGSVAFGLLALRAARSGLLGRVQPGDADAAVAAAGDAFRAEATGAPADLAGVHLQLQFAGLAKCHSTWTKAEAAGFGPAGPSPRSAESDTPGSVRGGIRSPIRRRRGFGPKKCTRCKKLKSAGSGHGRSSCDDGVSVALNVPYPAPPGWMHSQGGGT